MDINIVLWEQYDPDMDFTYPSKDSKWDSLLEKSIATKNYSALTKDETLNILFGLHHRNRVVDGLWLAMFEQGVMQQLLGQLLMQDTETLS